MSTATPTKTSIKVDPAYLEARKRREERFAAETSTAPTKVITRPVASPKRHDTHKPTRREAIKASVRRAMTQKQDGREVVHWSFFSKLILVANMAFVVIWTIIMWSVISPALEAPLTARGVGVHTGTVWAFYLLIMLAGLIAISWILSSIRDSHGYYRFRDSQNEPDNPVAAPAPAS